MYLLFSRGPPVMHLQGSFVRGEGSAPADPQDSLWEGGDAAARAGLPGRAHVGRCCPRGGRCRRRRRPSLSADLHAHQRQLCCRLTSRDAGGGSGRGAGIPAGGCWGAGSSSSLGEVSRAEPEGGGVGALGCVIQGLRLANRG